MEAGEEGRQRITGIQGGEIVAAKVHMRLRLRAIRIVLAMDIGASGPDASIRIQPPKARLQEGRGN
jgi:hypothetical protein